MNIAAITESNAHVHLNLAQIYEAEFAPLTGVLPDRDGRFWQHTARAEGERFGYLLYHDELPGGFAMFRYVGETLLVEELFVCPHLRRKRGATRFLKLVAERHAGLWDIRQLAAAHSAQAFWRRWASHMDPAYTEDVLEDAKWGTVTRQLVRVRPSHAISATQN